MLAVEAASAVQKLTEHEVEWVFLDIVIIVVLARFVGALFKRIRQPAVVGEILAGIMLGPSLLGLIDEDLPGRLFPAGGVRVSLFAIAQLGLVIFMFIVGLEFDAKLIRGNGRVAGVVSISSIVLPFGLGLLLASAIYSSHDVFVPMGHRAPIPVDATAFALFVGASMSVTAFPVLARILIGRNMHRTRIGALALSCAAVDDILAWSLLAVVVAYAGNGSALDLFATLGKAGVFVAVMYLVVRPLLERLADRYRRNQILTPNMLGIVVVGFLLSGYATSRLGIHAIFGAFLFGVIMPRRDTVALFREILARIEDVTVLLFLPVFFVVTGLGVDVRKLGSDAIVELPLILLVACAGKFLGASIAARAQGLRPRQAGALGVLMNTRGLTELVILSIGLEKQILDTSMYTMLVIMAVLTTVITEPILRRIYPDRYIEYEIAEAERAALGVDATFRVLTFSDSENAGLAAALPVAQASQPSEIVLSRLEPAPRVPELGSSLLLSGLTEALDDLHQVAAGVEQAGVRCVPTVRYSDDVPTDLRRQVETAGPEWVVVEAGGDRAEVLDDLWATSPVAVATVYPGEVGSDARRVVALVGDGDDGLAALEWALRTARGAALPLTLATGGARGRSERELGRWAQRIGDAGIVCHVAPPGIVPEELDRVVLVTSGDPDPLPGAERAARTIAVRARDRVVEEVLDDLLDVDLADQT